MRWSIPSLFSRPKTAAKKRVPHRNPLRLELLEDRLTPAGFFLTGVGGLTQPNEANARIFDSTNTAGGSQTFLQPPADMTAFPGFTGSVRVASGDINGDGFDDIVCAQGGGPGSGSQVRVFDGARALGISPTTGLFVGNGTAVEIASFFVYSNSGGASQTPGFGGGVFVACADFNGDGVDELVTSAGAGARGHIKVFNFNVGGVFQGSNPELRSSFYAYTDFAGEIRVTTLQVGTTAFLVTGSGAGTSQCDVRAYSNAFTIGEIPDLTPVPALASFFPFAGYTGGVSVAAGDTDGDGTDELFVSKNSGESTVLVIDANTLATRSSFIAFNGFTGEVRLGAADVDGDGKCEVLTSTGESPGAGGAHVKAWSFPANTPTETRSFFAYEGYSQGVFLSTNDYNWGQIFAGTPNFALPNNGVYQLFSISVDPRTFLDSSLRPKTVLVSVNITGTILSEVDVYLKGPNGVFTELSTGNGGTSNGMNVVFSDTAPTNITTLANTNTVKTGTFRPESGNLLLNYGSAPAAGIWTLYARDRVVGDTHTLVSWSLGFEF